jgi:hypothetical protein
MTWSPEIFLTFPDYAAYQMAMLQRVEGMGDDGETYINYVHRWPAEQMSVIVWGQNTWTNEDGTTEERPGYLVNVRVIGELPEDLAPYAREEPPASPKVRHA